MGEKSVEKNALNTSVSRRNKSKIHMYVHISCCKHTKGKNLIFLFSNTSMEGQLIQSQ